MIALIRSLSVIDPYKLQTQHSQYYSALQSGSRTSVAQPLAHMLTDDDSIFYQVCISSQNMSDFVIFHELSGVEENRSTSDNAFAITKKTEEPTEKEESPETIPIPSTDMAIDGDTKKDDKATDGDENTEEVHEIITPKPKLYMQNAMKPNMIHLPLLFDKSCTFLYVLLYIFSWVDLLMKHVSIIPVHYHISCSKVCH